MNLPTVYHKLLKTKENLNELNFYLKKKDSETNKGK